MLPYPERITCGWLPYYRPFRFASQPFDWLADSSVFSGNSILHRIKYSFFFCQYDENKFGKVYKKGAYKVENRMKTKSCGRTRAA